MYARGHMGTRDGTARHVTNVLFRDAAVGTENQVAGGTSTVFAFSSEPNYAP